MNVSYALIADAIRPREFPDRRRAQCAIHETLDRVAEGLALTQRPYAMVGDGLQAVSVTPADALALTMRTCLLLPDGLGLRLGVEVGAIFKIEGAAGSGADGTPGRSIQDGSVWWAACEVIEKAHHPQDAGRSFIRAWLRTHPDVVGGSRGERSERERATSSVLILCNQTTLRLQSHQCRIMAELFMGVTQIETVCQEKVSQ